tara:strand:- start:15 stop:365 length:351 start_codon:yes stop_codon:yes gene_type:complete
MPTKMELLSQRVEVLEKQIQVLMAEKSADEKPKKQKKQKKDDEKPKKKRVSGWILFQKAMREDVKESLQLTAGEGQKIKSTEVMTELAKQWKALEEEVREKWNDKAAEQKASDSEE